MIKTSSWFTKLPSDHFRIGISRGQPRNAAAGFRMYRKLAPGPWFHSVGVDEYRQRYQAEILDRLDPAEVVRELEELAVGRHPVLLCYEAPNGSQGFCHRSLVSLWFASTIGLVVPEFGYERCAHDQHPLLPGIAKAV
jgi:hypothetical protein